VDSNVFEGGALVAPAREKFQGNFPPFFNPGMAVEHLPEFSLAELIFGSANGWVVSLVVVG
jgi:hypothetical protein